ncbi:hypothetical protein [Bradyrhizobium sp. CCBAU 65884]|nr:hypothetical protein [Bradyrhizobium sp. CCBAU 65884]
MAYARLSSPAQLGFLTDDALLWLWLPDEGQRDKTLLSSWEFIVIEMP